MRWRCFDVGYLMSDVGVPVTTENIDSTCQEEVSEIEAQ